MEDLLPKNIISQLYQNNDPLETLEKKPLIPTDKPEISIILPCRNEQQALPFVLDQIKNTIQKNNINAEILISDSSNDNSIEIIKKFVSENPNQIKIRVIRHNKAGYGNAYLEAFPHAKADYLFMADCDGTYDFKEIPNFLKSLKEGNDFVIGNRFAYKIEQNVMPWSHKYIGNPVLSGLLRLFFGTSVKDSHCGMRAMSKEALERLKLQTTGMEFASEMVIKALKNKLKIKQLPINYHPRIGESKLNTMTDGWRHLRFMLLYSPLFLFFIPGFMLFLLGILTLFWFYISNPQLLGITLQIHPMFISSLLVIIGYQLIIFSIFAKTYAIIHLNEKSPLENFYKYITIERASIIGSFLSIIGLGIFLIILYTWIKSGFSDLDQIKNAISGLTLLVIGIQTIFSSFMLSILGIREK
jgi:glycosyltransferase involved in cell wall biosynthesis